MKIKRKLAKPFSFRERQIIQELIKDNHTGAGIGRLLNRTRQNVNIHIRESGGREAYDAAESYREKNSPIIINIQRDDEPSPNLKMPTIQKSPEIESDCKKKDPLPRDIIKRIEKMEVQIKIILEILEGKKDE